MGAHYTYTCDACGLSFETSGPWEFYRDESGTLMDYGHPGPHTEEAEQRGIYGFYCELFCPSCLKTEKVIVVEYKKPAACALSAHFGNLEVMDKYREPGAVKCPDCGNLDLILFTRENQILKCPLCKDGAMKGGMDWVS